MARNVEVNKVNFCDCGEQSARSLQLRSHATFSVESVLWALGPTSFVLVSLCWNPLPTHTTSDACFGGYVCCFWCTASHQILSAYQSKLRPKLKSLFKKCSHRRRAVTSGFAKLWAFAVTEASLDSSGPARRRARCPFLWDWEGAADTDTSPDASRPTVRVLKCRMREFRSDPDLVPGNGASFCPLQGVSTNATLTAFRVPLTPTCPCISPGSHACLQGALLARTDYNTSKPV